jgi:hypothetical protein
LSARTILAAASAPLVLAGCFSVGYSRELREVAPDPALVESFEPGAELGAVLAALGAPLDVWEGAAGSVVVSYGGLRTREWAFEVSVPVAERGSASFAFDDARTRTSGHVLVFGPDLRLEILRAGNLADLRRETARRRAAALEDDDAGDAP